MKRSTLASMCDEPAGTVADLAALLREVRAEQVRQGEALAAIVRLLERGRGARDEADATLLEGIKESFRDRTFTSANVLTMAQARPLLAAALQSADITNARELGHLLARLEGTPSRGLTIARVNGDHRAGILWRCELCEL